MDFQYKFYILTDGIVFAVGRGNGKMKRFGGLGDNCYTFMANIKAFRGYRYNTDKIDNLGSVISPPYYNMTKEDKDALYDKSEYNSVRLFSGKSLKVIQDEENTFTRAKNYLDKWIEDGILVRDEEPVIYME